METELLTQHEKSHILDRVGQVGSCSMSAAVHYTITVEKGAIGEFHFATRAPKGKCLTRPPTEVFKNAAFWHFRL
jgi:hypothetical protein